MTINTPIRTVDISNDFTPSVIHNPRVIVLKPYFFSILNVLYKLKGIDSRDSAYIKIRKNTNPDRIKGRFSEIIQELYKSRIPPNRNIRKRNWERFIS